MKTRILSHYQEQQVDLLFSAYTMHVPAVTVAVPIGAGKSTILQSALLLANPRAALVLTPPALLETSLAWPEAYTLTHRGAKTTVSSPAARWRLLRDETTPWDWTGFGLGIHTLSRMLTRAPVDLRGVVVVIDEVDHHQGHGSDLYQFARWALSNNAMVWLFTTQSSTTAPSVGWARSPETRSQKPAGD